MSIFGPALEAMATLGDLDGMVRLLLREMVYHERSQGRSGWPSVHLFLKGMEGFHRAERYAESVELFKIAVNGPQEYIIDISSDDSGEVEKDWVEERDGGRVGGEEQG